MKFIVQICISVIQIRTSVKKFSVYIIQIKIRDESIQIRHRSGQRLNWMTVLRTCCIFGNLNDINLDLNGVNANSNAAVKIKSNDESVVHDPNLLNWMLIKWIWSTKLRNWPGKPIIIIIIIIITCIISLNNSVYRLNMINSKNPF